MHKKKDKLTWRYDGERFTVGESVLEGIAENAIRNVLGQLIVFFEGNLYVCYLINSEKCGIEDIYQKRKPYWTSTKRVFQVLKVE